MDFWDFVGLIGKTKSMKHISQKYGDCWAVLVTIFLKIAILVAISVAIWGKRIPQKLGAVAKCVYILATRDPVVHDE